MTPSVVLRDARSVVVVPGRGPVRGEDFGRIEVLEHASVVCEGDAIASVGDAGDAALVVDASGCTVVPGFVDCHTHLPFLGWRADEDAARLAGATYERLHLGERGIYRSASLLRDAADDDVISFCRRLALSMLGHGTTTFETKSGYGLSVAAELRQLRLARRLAQEVPQTVVSSCLAAHAVPKDRTAGEWIGIVSDELLPAVAREGLAAACDVYVEAIAFQLEHAARLATVAGELGIAMRMHADQLEDGQAGSFAARWGFASADHLNHTSRAAVGDLASSDTAAVLLPGASFTLRQASRPPARALLDAGAIVALASDLNPGTSPIHSMPFVVALACRMYGLRPLEALAAATVNGAYVLGLADRIGRIAPGYRADLVMLDVASFDEVPYRPDHDPVVAVVAGGDLAYVAPHARERIHS